MDKHEDAQQKPEQPERNMTLTPAEEARMERVRQDVQRFREWCLRWFFYGADENVDALQDYLRANQMPVTFDALKTAFTDLHAFAKLADRGQDFLYAFDRRMREVEEGKRARLDAAELAYELNVLFEEMAGYILKVFKWWDDANKNKGGFYNLIDVLEHGGRPLDDLEPIDLEAMPDLWVAKEKIRPVLLAVTSDDAMKAYGYRFDTGCGEYEMGTLDAAMRNKSPLGQDRDFLALYPNESTLADRRVVLLSRDENLAQKLLPHVFSLKTLDHAPDRWDDLVTAIQQAPERRLRLAVVYTDALLDEKIPQREALLTTEKGSPLLYVQSINQIFAWRGTGKTYIALGIAQALAIGGQFLGWKATRPSNVLYVEGEMPTGQIQERLQQVVGKTNSRLRLITLDKQPNNEIPSLATALGQRLIEEALDNAEVLVLDSISTLFNISTNEEENWLSIQNWLRRLRSRGLCVIFIHHAGKSGLQRGSSKSEDMLDISMKLSRPDDYRITDGLRCVLEFDKTRGTVILDGDPIEVRLETVDGKVAWTWCPAEDAQYSRAGPAGCSSRALASGTRPRNSRSAKARSTGGTAGGRLVTSVNPNQSSSKLSYWDSFVGRRVGQINLTQIKDLQTVQTVPRGSVPLLGHRDIPLAILMQSG